MQAILVNLCLILHVTFQIKPFFKVLRQCFINKNMQKAYNIWCTFLKTTDPDCVKLLQYYSSVQVAAVGSVSYMHGPYW